MYIVTMKGDSYMSIVVFMLFIIFYSHIKIIIYAYSDF